MHRIVIFIGLILFLGAGLCFAEDETLTITTYYPAPYGVYKTLRLYPSATQPESCQEGELYYDSDDDKIYICSGDAGFETWQSVGGTHGTILYTRCAWASGGFGISTCLPPDCPAGWTDLGVLSNAATEATRDGNYGTSGYQERACYIDTDLLLVYTKCAWVRADPAVGSCVPPSCPTGWNDLGINNVCTASNRDENYASSGYQERICAR